MKNHNLGKFKISKNVIYLPLDKNNFDLPKIQKDIIEKEDLTLKNEFHLTLVNLDFLYQFLEIEIPMEEFRLEILDVFSKFIKDKDISIKAGVKEHLIKKADKKTLIFEVAVSDIDGLFLNFSKKFNVNFPVQFSHTTLYTKTGEGIFINSKQELDNYSVLI